MALLKDNFMLKTLSKSLREYKRTSVLAVLLTITEVVFEIIIPPVWRI